MADSPDHGNPQFVASFMAKIGGTTMDHRLLGVARESSDNLLWERCSNLGFQRVPIRHGLRKLRPGAFPVLSGDS